MLAAAVNYFYPDLKKDEIKKFGLLAFTLFLIVGAYWLLRLLKDTIFFKIAFPVTLGWQVGQGRLFQPTAKFWSPFVVFVLVLVYSKLVDLFKKHTLFYIICSFYAVLFASISLILVMRTWYGDLFLGKYALALVGWITYFAIESFGSLVVALFWSFTNSVTDAGAAKRGYALIIACAQLGAIIGSSLMFFAHIWQLLALASLLTASVMIVIRHFMRVIPADQQVGDRTAAKEDKKHEGESGFLAGIRLLFTRPYLVGIFMVSTLYEVIGQVIEFQMKSQADVSPLFIGELGFAQFQGIYGVATNVLSFLMALLGTSYLIKRFGLRFGLLFYPMCLIIAFVLLFLFFMYGNPSAMTLLFATFVTMMIAKGLGYAVNSPVKEMMYIPTSKDVKYKTKSFTDVFGGRMAKMGGSRITEAFKHNLSDLMIFGTLWSLGISIVWVAAALYVGKKNAQLVHDHKIVE